MENRGIIWLREMKRWKPPAGNGDCLILCNYIVSRSWIGAVSSRFAAVLALLLMLSAANGFAQVHKFTQVFNQPLILNPAYAGNIEFSRIIINTSRRWPGFSQGKLARFDSYSISVDQFFPNPGIAGGIILTHDRSGSANLVETNVGLVAAKEFSGDGWVFRFGMQADYGTMNIDFSDLVFEDQLIIGGSSQEPLLGTTGNAQFFDFSAGALFSVRQAWIGLAFHHLNEPDISLVDEKTELPHKMTVHGGYRLPEIGRTTFELTGIYQKQRTIDQMSLGLSMKYTPKGPKAGIRNPVDVHAFEAGIRYSGISFTEEVTINSGRVDPFALILGIEFLNFPISSIIYNYEMPFLSNLSTSTGGAHEISIRLHTNGTIVPCPKDRNLWKNRQHYPIMDAR